ncbi:MAG: GNAT family N-acetyltransferase [Pseudomonadota bacterium]
MTLRAMTDADLDWVLALNRVHEAELSPLDRARLADLSHGAFSATVAEPQAGFLITFDQDADYDSPNFLWQRARYPRFVYVDRIAIDAAHRRKGLAEALYADLFTRARAAGHEVICCEVNSDPPNPASDRFHARLGFEVVGERHLDDRGKTVRYYARPLTDG